MRYFLLRRQKGQGCDYTIGCGLSFSEIRAQTREEAIAKVIDLPDDWKDITDEGTLHDMICDTGLIDVRNEKYDRQMDEIYLFEINTAIDLIPILKQKLAEVDAHKTNLQEKKREAAELVQYEKLKKKFEK